MDGVSETSAWKSGLQQVFHGAKKTSLLCGNISNLKKSLLSVILQCIGVVWVKFTAASCEVISVPTSHSRDWVDYRDGFGDFKLWNDEFWLGNERMHSLLSDGQKLLKSKNPF